MIPLTQLLARFKNLTNTEKIKKEVIIEEIKACTGISIPISTVSILKNTIFLKVSPIIRTEIFLKKEEIIKKINNIHGLNHISDIK